MLVIVSEKLSKLLAAYKRLGAARALAFGLMLACLATTLSVTASGLREASASLGTEAAATTTSADEKSYFTAFSGDLASLNIDSKFTVTIEADGQEYTVRMLYGTVADALESAGITLDEDDYTEPALDEAVVIGDSITVHRVSYQQKTESQVVPHDTEYVYTSLYFRDTDLATTLQNGTDGECTVTTLERWVDGELENSEVTDITTTVEPTDHVVKVYGAGAPVSPLTGPDGTTNAPTSYTKVLTGKATGYYSKSGKGASGLGLGYGTVAVDPDVIPYGTLLYIASTDGSFVYGYAIATDTGLALQNGQILVDLFYETYAESVLNGAMQVNVYVVG